MNKNLILVMLLLVATVSVQAQVTIGGVKIPETFSILELICGSGDEDRGGLRLPQLTIREREFLSSHYGSSDDMQGVQIFNRYTQCVETWNGSEWIQECLNDTPAMPPVSPFDDASCGINSSGDNKIFTCIEDPNAVAYEWFVDDVFQQETTTNSITFTSAQTPALVTVKCLYSPAFLKPTMIDVTGGDFTIGAATTSVAPVAGSGTVTLSDFKMSETLVTQAQFSAVMGANPSYFACGKGGATSGGLNYRPNSDLPVEFISWYAAIVYCNKLSIMEDKTPVYSIAGIDSLNLSGVGSNGQGWRNIPFSAIPTPAANSGERAVWNAVTQNRSANGYRLPTEAEWEYAARGGRRSITNDDGVEYDYSGGSNVLTDVGWYSGNNGGTNNTSAPFYGTKSVKNKVPNALGLYDMSGNVYEWCWNWFQNYSSDDIGTNPVGPTTPKTYRVIRGGYWGDNENKCRVSYREVGTPENNAAFGYGFRVVLGS